MIKFSDLNEQQKQAVIDESNHLRIIAGAGSGKTAVLVQRIITKVVKDNIDIDRILVLTYTEAAAGERQHG